MNIYFLNIKGGEFSNFEKVYSNKYFNRLGICETLWKSAVCFVWKETNSITVTEVHQFSTYNVNKKKQVTILKIILSLSNQLLVTARIENLVMEDWTFKNVNKCCYHLCGLWSDCNVLIFWLFFVSLESSMLWVSILVFKIKCKFQIKGY